MATIVPITFECTCKENQGLILNKDLYWFNSSQEKEALQRLLFYKENYIHYIKHEKWLYFECKYWAVHIDGKHLTSFTVQ